MTTEVLDALPDVAVPTKTIALEGRGRDRSFRMELNGQLVGYAPTYLAAETELNRLVYERLSRQPIQADPDTATLAEEPDPLAPPPLLALLSIGPDLRAATALHLRYAQLQWSRQSDAQATRAAILVNPTLALLAHLGYERNLSGEWTPLHRHVESGRGSLGPYMPPLVRSAARADGWIIQTITLVALEAAVTTALDGLDDLVSTYYPGLVSYALAGIPGPAWTLADDGHAITRILPPWPVRIALAEEPAQGYFGTRDERIPVGAWAVDAPYIPDGKPIRNQPARLVFVSTMLPPSRAKQFAAYIRRNPTQAKPMQLTLPNGVARAINATRWGDEGQPYDILATAVDEGQLHLVVQHTSVLAPSGGIVYHITGPDGVPDWGLLWAQLDAALVLAFPQEVLPAIWAAAIAEGLVVSLRSYGCQGYAINPDQPRRWALAIGTALGRPTTVTMHGGLAADAAVDMDDDGDADDGDADDDDL